jgi:Protein of unknown function (DUF4038)/Domain of unknown function (DUF5060)
MEKIIKSIVWGQILLYLLCYSNDVKATELEILKWSVQEFQFKTKENYSNPYAEVSLIAIFTGPKGIKQNVKGYWDGGKIFTIRFTPTIQGNWSYVTESNDPNLNHQKGNFKCILPLKSSHGFLRKDIKNPYHFTFDDQTRFFMFGQTYYYLMCNAMMGDNWKTAVEKSRSFGMNKVRMQVIADGKPNKSQYYPAVSPFQQISTNGFDRNRINLAFWQKLDEVVKFMAEKEMIADLIVFWSTPESYGTEQENKNILKYIVARYAAFPNVIWCVANEWNYTKQPKELFNDLGKLIQSEDAWATEAKSKSVRLLSVHQQTRQDFQFFDQPWLTHAIVQLGVRNQGKIFRDGNEWNANNAAEEGRTFQQGDEWGNYSITFNYGHNMPVVNDEYGYIGEHEDRSIPKDEKGKYLPLSRAKHRQIIWGIYAGGGYASAGDKNEYADGRPYFSANWHETEEYGDIKRLVDFFTTKNIAYWKMKPHNELAKSGERVYVLADSGKQYIIYAAAGGSITVQIEKGNYEVRQYNPRIGEDISLQKTQGGLTSFTLPDKQDWVVYLKAKKQ